MLSRAPNGALRDFPADADLHRWPFVENGAGAVGVSGGSGCRPARGAPPCRLMQP
jgi:hypothetical protein